MNASSGIIQLNLSIILLAALRVAHIVEDTIATKMYGVQ